MTDEVLTLEKIFNILKVNTIKIKNFLFQLKDCLLSSESSSIAFTSMFSIVPFIAIISFVSSYFVDINENMEWLFSVLTGEGKQTKFMSSVVSYINNSHIGDINNNNISIDKNPNLYIGIFCFWFSITGVYSEIEKFFNKIWEKKDSRSWFEKRFNKKVSYVILYFIVLFVLIAIVRILLINNNTPFLNYFIFFPCCWLTIYLAYKFIPLDKPKPKNAIVSSLIISLLITITIILILSCKEYVVKNYKEIYGSLLFFYLLVYQIIWTEILAGCRLTFELEFGFSNYMGEKRLQWKNLSYQQKEALCWHIYNNDLKNTDIDPKIKIWTLEKLYDLDFIDRKDSIYSIKEPKKNLLMFHNSFYKNGNVKLPDETSNTIKDSLDNIKKALEKNLDKAIKSRIKELEKQNDKLKKEIEMLKQKGNEVSIWKKITNKIKSIF